MSCCRRGRCAARAESEGAESEGAESEGGEEEAREEEKGTSPSSSPSAPPSAVPAAPRHARTIGEGCSETVEAHQETTQKIGQNLLVLPSEGCEKLPFPGDQVGQAGVHAAPPGRCEAHEDTPSVVRIRAARDEAGVFQAVEAVRHGPRADERAVEEAAWGELVGGSGPPQGGEDVEGPLLEVMGGKGRATGTIEMAGETDDSAQHLQGGGVDIGPLPLPLDYETINLVRCRRCLHHTRILTARTTRGKTLST
jgi:hypothetical protein